MSQISTSNNSPSTGTQRKTHQLSTSKSAISISPISDESQSKEEYEAEIKSLMRDKQVLQAKLEKLENASSKKNKQLDSEKELRLQANRDRYWLQQKLTKLQMALQARLKLLNVDFSNCNDLGEALDAAFGAIQKLATSLTEKEELISRLENEKMQISKDSSTLHREIEKLTKIIKDKESVIDEQAKAINDKQRLIVQVSSDGKKEVESQLKQQQQQVNDLQNELASYKHDNEALKTNNDEMQQKLNEMAKIRQEFEEFQIKTDQKNKEKEEEIINLKTKNEQLTKEREQMVDVVNKLQTEREKKDEEFKKLQQQFAETTKQLNDIAMIKKDEKEVQTDLNTSYFDKIGNQLAKVDELTKDAKEKDDIINEHEQRLRGLANENKSLLEELDTLLKQAARFQPDGSNHTGELLAMVSSPKNFVIATSGSDRTVRLWSINPKAETKKQVTPYACSRMTGTALSLAFSTDGKYLVSGIAYQNGPEGSLIIWNMEKGDGDVEQLYRSRPTLRFGRAHCVCWSNDDRYIFSGDTTGTIWVWDVERQVQLAEIQAHKDIVHDIGVSRGILFSCSLDQSLCCFEIKELNDIPIKKLNFHEHQPKKLKAILLDKHDQYPYWSLSPTEDCNFIVAGGRKVYVYSFDSKKKAIGKGPNVSDTDLDHVKFLVVRNSMICICRQNTPRAKIFDLESGKELKKISFKSPVSKVVFTYDAVNVVVATQAAENKVHQPPNLRLWSFNNNDQKNE